tara:strand:- start:518 stop:835 length:318 start_codon:yes stop_codon:yes gene_type:complete
MIMVHDSISKNYAIFNWLIFRPVWTCLDGPFDETVEEPSFLELPIDVSIKGAPYPILSVGSNISQFVAGKDVTFASSVVASIPELVVSVSRLLRADYGDRSAISI